MIVLDSFTSVLKPAKSRLADFAAPFYWMTDVPGRLGEWVDDKMTSRGDLQVRLDELETEQHVHKGRLLRMADLAAENVRLRQLLNATELLKDRVLVTEIIGVSPDPAAHEVTINRGTNDGVFEGQAVLDAYGLMGQIREVHSSFSRVLLITDATHALPVQVLRNGVRSIAEGVGDYGALRLRYIAPTTDIKAGDELVSSGLGGRFPTGYPVGTVDSISIIEGRGFMDVVVKPTAWLDRSRHLLLIFSDIDKLEE